MFLLTIAALAQGPRPPFQPPGLDENLPPPAPALESAWPELAEQVATESAPPEEPPTWVGPDGCHLVYEVRAVVEGQPQQLAHVRFGHHPAIRTDAPTWTAVAWDGSDWVVGRGQVDTTLLLADGAFGTPVASPLRSVRVAVHPLLRAVPDPDAPPEVAHGPQESHGPVETLGGWDSGGHHVGLYRVPWSRSWAAPGRVSAATSSGREGGHTDVVATTAGRMVYAWGTGRRDETIHAGGALHQGYGIEKAWTFEVRLIDGCDGPFLSPAEPVTTVVLSEPQRRQVLRYARQEQVAIHLADSPAAAFVEQLGAKPSGGGGRDGIPAPSCPTTFRVRGLPGVSRVTWRAADDGTELDLGGGRRIPFVRRDLDHVPATCVDDPAVRAFTDAVRNTTSSGPLDPCDPSFDGREGVEGVGMHELDGARLEGRRGVLYREPAGSDGPGDEPLWVRVVDQVVRVDDGALLFASSVTPSGTPVTWTRTNECP